jgi:hypothetical protein
MPELVGRTIREVRKMTRDELAAEYWHPRAGEHPVIVVLDDGTTLYASCDSEGNGPGALFGTDGQGRSFRLVARSR